jgi:hypothetical protein
LLFAIAGGAAGAFVLTSTVTAVTFGVLWVFVFGDDPWPAWVEPATTVLVPLFAIGAWVYLASLIWRSLEARRRSGD